MVPKFLVGKIKLQTNCKQTSREIFSLEIGKMRLEHERKKYFFSFFTPFSDYLLINMEGISTMACCMDGAVPNFVKLAVHSVR